MAKRTKVVTQLIAPSEMQEEMRRLHLMQLTNLKQAYAEGVVAGKRQALQLLRDALDTVQA